MLGLLLFYTIIFTTIEAIFKSIFYTLENKHTRVPAWAHAKQINNKFITKLQRYNVNKINAIGAAAAVAIIYNMRFRIEICA